MKTILFSFALVIILSSCNRGQLRYTDNQNGIQWAASPTPKNILLDENQSGVAITEAEKNSVTQKELKDETSFQTASANDDEQVLNSVKNRKNVLETFVASYHAIKKNPKSFGIHHLNPEDEPEEGLNMLAVISFILTILSMVGSVAISFIALPQEIMLFVSLLFSLAAIAAIVLAIIALSQIKKRGGTGKAFAWATLIIQGVAIVVSIIVLLIVLIFFLFLLGTV